MQQPEGQKMERNKMDDVDWIWSSRHKRRRFAIFYASRDSNSSDPLNLSTRVDL